MAQGNDRSSEEYRSERLGDTRSYTLRGEGSQKRQRVDTGATSAGQDDPAEDRVERTVVLNRDEIRRVAEQEAGDKAEAGNTAQMPLSELDRVRNQHIHDSDRAVRTAGAHQGGGRPHVVRSGEGRTAQGRQTRPHQQHPQRQTAPTRAQHGQQRTAYVQGTGQQHRGGQPQGHGQQVRRQQGSAQQQRQGRRQGAQVQGARQAQRHRRPAGQQASQAYGHQQRQAQQRRRPQQQPEGQARHSSQQWHAQQQRPRQQASAQARPANRRQVQGHGQQQGARRRPQQQAQHQRQGQQAQRHPQGQRQQGGYRPQPQGQRPSQQQRRHRVPVAAIVGAAVVFVLVVIGIVRCNNARVATQQQAALEAQQQAEQQAQEQAKPTEIAGLSEGTYYIEPYDTESGVLAFDVSGVGDDAYTTVVVTELTQTTDQQIQLTVSDDGQSCTLTNGDLYLDAGDVTAGSGRSLFANKSDGGDTQRWQLQRNSDGTYSIVSLADSNLAIAVESAYDGAGVTVQDTDSTESSQHFRIVAQDRVATGSSTDDESANGNANSSANSNSGSGNSSSSNTSEE